MANGWNLWVWLQCIGVVMGVVVRKYIDILIIIGSSYINYIIALAHFLRGKQVFP